MRGASGALALFLSAVPSWAGRVPALSASSRSRAVPLAASAIAPGALAAPVWAVAGNALAPAAAVSDAHRGMRQWDGDASRELLSAPETASVGAADSGARSLLSPSRTEEFPNLFLPAGLRHADLETASAVEKARLERALRKARGALEGALGSVFDRLVVPVYLPGEKEPRAERFFALAQRIARERDPSARVVPSGGVVRSALGLLYEEMLRESESDPSFDAVTLLNRVVEGRHPMFDANGSIMGFDVRGVGSDFDLLLEAKPEAFDAISGAIEALFKPAGTERLDKAEDPDDMNKAFFTVADLKPLRRQRERSERQGGASIDLLVYDLDRRALIDPERQPGVVDELLRGFYRYLPALAGLPRDDPDSTTMRGPRGLVELPFLRLERESRERLDGELRELLRGVESGRYPREKAIQQIAKMRRNGRLSMANNSVLRAPAESSLGLVRRIAQLLEEKRQAQLLKFPTEIRFQSYTPRYALDAARQRRTRKLPLELQRYLIPKDKFLERYTAGGALYHGTSAQGALGALRGGFWQSEHELGIRRGTYSTPLSELADGYARTRGGDLGYLLRLPIRADAAITAFDSAAQAHPAFRRIAAEAKAAGMESADWLAQEYGIDFITLGEQVVLIKNADALRRVTLPSLVRDSVDFLNQEIRRPDADFARLLVERKRLAGAAPLFRALGIEVGSVPPLDEIMDRAVEAMPRMKDAVKMLYVYNQLDPARRGRLGPKDFGGRSFAENFGAAMGSSVDLVFEVFSHGWTSSHFSFDKAVADPEWPGLFRGSLAALRERAVSASDAGLAFPWLRAFARALSDSNKYAGILLDGEAESLARAIPESVYASIREAAAAQPIAFEGIDDVQERLSEAAGRPVDLTSAAIAERLRQIEDSPSVADKLTALELLSWSGSIYDSGADPKVLSAIRDAVPLIREHDQLMRSGTQMILWGFRHADRGLGSDEIGLLERVLRSVLKSAPDADALASRRQERSMLGNVVSVVLSREQARGGEVLALLREAHNRYDLGREMPGYWPELEPILERDFLEAVTRKVAERRAARAAAAGAKPR